MSNPITPGQLSDWAFETAAYTDGTEPTTYVPVRGITEFTPPAIEKNQEDDGDFDGGVWSSSTSTGLGYKVEGKVKIPRGGLAKDPGQEILRAAGIGVAEDGYVHWRAFDKLSGEGWKGVADSTFTENGGPKTDLKTAAFSLTGRGELLPFTGGTTADASATAILAAGVLKGATIGKGGSGYTKPPTVVITGPGTGAVATASVKDGAVVDINVTTGGTGYTTADITFTRVP
ncbi:phage tail tube protein [Arthrobacter sp. GMC3]|uniref:phage tail tube protein n=1 Tax=Arthrobacter sp. GMC3 TaxID=2058894 RepID=UPI000CE5283C|nr:hypothetical protein [Arthrobacter sp. GMC3]